MRGESTRAGVFAGNQPPINLAGELPKKESVYRAHDVSRARVTPAGGGTQSGPMPHATAERRKEIQNGENKQLR